MTELRDVGKALKSCSQSSPAFSMRGKTSFGNEDRYRNTGGELAGDLSKKVDAILTVNPKWSLRGRSTGITKPTDFPGPGNYKIPTTLDRSHPLLPSCGKGWTMTARPKIKSSITDPTELYCKGTPDPQRYDTSNKGKIGTKLQQSVASYTMRAKIKDPMDREKRPGCQAYTTGNCTKDGPISTPSYTMASRGNFAAKSDKKPGPGEHHWPTDANGAKNRQPVFSFSKNARFTEAKKDPRMF